MFFIIYVFKCAPSETMTSGEQLDGIDKINGCLMTGVLKMKHESDLSEERMRRGFELLFFAYRDFISDSDAILSKYSFGRAHHRVVYFVGRHPKINVSELLSILQITKQSLSRVLSQLIEQGFITQTPGSTDRRQRLLELSDKGVKLEHSLWEQTSKRFITAYKECGDASIGFEAILRNMMNDDLVAPVRQMIDGK